jgi:hypothetical protein
MKPRALCAIALFVGLAACQITTTEPVSPEPEPEPAATQAPAPVATSAASTKPSEGDLLDKLKNEKVCTEMGCVDGFHVGVDPEVWPKGRYQLELEADGKKSTCEASLPLPACGKKAVSCKGDVEVMIGESGCALPPEQHGLGPFTFKGKPAKVAITVKRGGKEVGKASFSPAYKTVQPNGPSCPPTCEHATDKITVK